MILESVQQSHTVGLGTVCVEEESELKCDEVKFLHAKSFSDTIHLGKRAAPRKVFKDRESLLKK